MSTGIINQSAIQIGPDGNLPSIRPLQRISGTGATEAANATAFTPGEFVTLQNATSAPVVYLMAATSGLTNVVTAATGAILPPYGQQDWLITPRTRFVYCEAQDGTSAFDVRTFQSSGSPAESA